MAQTKTGTAQNDLSWYTDRVGKKITVKAINERHSHLNENEHTIADINDAKMLFDRQNLCYHVDVAGAKGKKSDV